MKGFPPPYKTPPPSGKIPEENNKPRTFKQFLKENKRIRILLLLAVLIGALTTGVALNNLLSNVINTNITVQAPQQIQLSLSSWPSSVTRGINASFSININNPNPNISGRWILNFTRGDGIQADDFKIWWWIDQNTAVELNKQLADGKLIFTSPSFTIPQGSNTAYFTILSQREGSYSVAIALAS